MPHRARADREVGDALLDGVLEQVAVAELVQPDRDVRMSLMPDARCGAGRSPTAIESTVAISSSPASSASAARAALPAALDGAHAPSRASGSRAGRPA